MTEMRWRKSGRSGKEGNCVELAWRKSSRSGQEGNCVELAHTSDGVRGSGVVRDSKNPSGPTLPMDMGSFLAAVKSGNLDH
jgi:hypothetical protein